MVGISRGQRTEQITARKGTSLGLAVPLVIDLFPRLLRSKPYERSIDACVRVFTNGNQVERQEARLQVRGQFISQPAIGTSPSLRLCEHHLEAEHHARPLTAKSFLSARGKHRRPYKSETLRPHPRESICLVARSVIFSFRFSSAAEQAAIILTESRVKGR